MDDHSKLILDYLKKNPKAGDTLEGITRWWLERERIENSVDKVIRALENLVEKGLVKGTKVKGGSLFYRVNKAN
jgi:Fe2+ or Zn2+ uptake regulation protein